MNLPQYKSHKIVGAAQILAINWASEEVVQLTLNEMPDPWEVSSADIEKHKPDVGWYLVQYENGYVSFSPAEPFENGNTKLPAYEWVENTGTRPAELDRGDYVNAKLRNGEIYKCMVVDMHGLEPHNWALDGDEGDIIAYCRPTGDEVTEQIAMRQECEEIEVQCREAIEHAQRMVALVRDKWAAKGYHSFVPSILGVVGNNISEQFESASTGFCQNRVMSIGRALIEKTGGTMHAVAIPIEDVLKGGDEAILKAVREITGSMAADPEATKH